MKLVFEQVDRIWTATGKENYYRIFPTEEGWIVYIHQFDGDGIPSHGIPAGTMAYDMAQAFAQAYEDGTADLVSARMAQAARVVVKERTVKE